LKDKEKQITPAKTLRLHAVAVVVGGGRISARHKQKGGQEAIG